MQSAGLAQAWGAAGTAAQPLGTQRRQSSRQLGAAAQVLRPTCAAAAGGGATARAGPSSEPCSSSQAPSIRQQLCGLPWGLRRRPAQQRRQRHPCPPCDAPDRHVSPEVPLACDDQASTIYTALQDLDEGSFDEAEMAAVASLQQQGGGAAAAALAAPTEQAGGVPHRWKVVGMMALSFVLCNMDKVRPAGSTWLWGGVWLGRQAGLLGCTEEVVLPPLLVATAVFSHAACGCVRINVNVAGVPMAKELGWSAPLHTHARAPPPPNPNPELTQVNMSVAVIPMAKELGWSAMERGLVSSSFFWGYSLTQIPAGWVSTRCAHFAWQCVVVLDACVCVRAGRCAATPPPASTPTFRFPALQHRRRTCALGGRGAVVLGYLDCAPCRQA